MGKGISSFYDGYKRENQSLRPPRILLDYGCDSPSLVTHLESFGLEVVCLWEHVADLYHHEIIELCSDQRFDLFVSVNERLFTPSEEWVNYLMPHRTKFFLVPRRKLRSTKNLVHEISQRIHAKQKSKDYSPRQKQLKIKNNAIKTLGGIPE